LLATVRTGGLELRRSVLWGPGVFESYMTADR